MHCRSLQQIHIRQLGVCRVAVSRCAAIVPGAKHRAHHHIHFAAGDVVNLPGIQHKLNQFLIYRHRITARQAVDGAQIIDTGVFMVDIKELVVFLQNAGNPG